MPGVFPAPAENFVFTFFLTVSDVERSRRYYAGLFDGKVVQENDPAVIQIANTWLILNPGGGPTPDKPGIVLQPPKDRDSASCFMNVRVADIAKAYAEWTAKGAEFLTPPIDKRGEIRCYIRDPDGYLIEIGQAKRGETG